MYVTYDDLKPQRVRMIIIKKSQSLDVFIIQDNAYGVIMCCLLFQWLHLGKEDLTLHFVNFLRKYESYLHSSTLRWYLKSFMEEKFRIIPHNLFHGCAWLGDASSQGISSHVVDLDLTEYSSLSTTRVKHKGCIWWYALTACCPQLLPLTVCFSDTMIIGKSLMKDLPKYLCTKISMMSLQDELQNHLIGRLVNVIATNNKTAPEHLLWSCWPMYCPYMV